MKGSTCPVGWLMVISAVTAAFGQQIGPAAGAMIDQKPCVFSPYEQQSRFTKRFYSKEDYESAGSSPRAECSRIVYMSDGLKVVGYLVRPRNLGAIRLPVIIFNRGGFLRAGEDRVGQPCGFHSTL